MFTLLFLLRKKGEKGKREKGEKGKREKREKGKKEKREKGKKGEKGKREKGKNLLKLQDFSKDVQKIKRGSGPAAAGPEEEKKTEKPKKQAK